MYIIIRKEINENKYYNYKKKTEFTANLIVRKKIVAQNRLNYQLVQQIQENKAKIKILKIQIVKLDKTIQNNIELIKAINEISKK